MACEIETSTMIKLIYGWSFIFLPNFDSNEKTPSVKKLYSWSAFIFAPILSVFWEIYVWTKLFWKLGFSIRKKIPEKLYSKISDQEFKWRLTK